MIEPPPPVKSKKERTIINIDAQKQLAKLLATEDIQVTIGNFKTAYFDVKNRVLGLPAWNTDSKEVSDLLVGHEVGHALFTPEDGITKFKERYPKLPFDIANIVEDIRIEKMIQFKYPGLIKSFNDGYAHFKETDLFEIANKDVNSLGFIDRINLKGKLRSLIDIDFNEEETELFGKVNSCKTYDDVLDVIQELSDYIDKEEKESDKEEAESQTDGSNDSETGESIQDNIEDSDDGDDENVSSSNYDDPSESPNQDGGDDSKYSDIEADSPYKSETQDSLDKHLEDLSEVGSNETILNSFPEKNVKKMIFSLDEVREARKNTENYSQIMNNNDVHDKWLSFKNTTKKNVMILCKEFERRKAANSYARATESQTGTINVNKLHSYKFDDRIFKTVTNLADGKNHGMNIFIDISGSMGNCISDVMKQTIQLIMFCKTVGIPFTVYSFTSKTGRAYFDNDSNRYLRDYNSKKYDFFRDNFTLGLNLDTYNTEIVELMNSDLNKNNYETALKELYIQSGALNSENIYIAVDVTYSGTVYKSNLPLAQNCMRSELEEMGGTPLTETLIMAHALIKKFKKAHAVEKMTTVFLTDGDGHCPKSHNTKPAEFDEEENLLEKNNSFYASGTGRDNYNNKRYIKVGKSTVDISRNNNNSFSELINIIKEETGSKMIGFYLTGNQQDGKNHAYNALSHINLRHFKNGRAEYIDKCKDIAKKQKSNCWSIDNGFNFDAYFIIDNLKKLKLHDDEEFVIPDTVDTEDLNKAVNRNKLATSFKNFNTAKRQSRIFLNKFIDTVI